MSKKKVGVEQSTPTDSQLVEMISTGDGLVLRSCTSYASTEIMIRIERGLWSIGNVPVAVGDVMFYRRALEDEFRRRSS